MCKKVATVKPLERCPKGEVRLYNQCELPLTKHRTTSYFIFQVDFILMLLATWVPAVRNAQMVLLLHLTKLLELELQIASLVH